MRSILYIVSKPPESWPAYKFVLPPGHDCGHKTVVLLENGVNNDEELSADNIYQLKEGNSDKMTELVGDAHPTSFISYRDLLDLIFTSENTVVV